MQRLKILIGVNDPTIRYGDELPLVTIAQL